MKSYLPVGLIIFLSASSLLAGEAAPRVLPAGQLPADSRLQPLRGEQGDFSLAPPKSAKDWKKRADFVRKTMRVSLGLWPKPSATPLNAIIHGKIDLGEYTVEKVYFESLPGFYVTGNLYRPKTKGKRPGVLSPHGHFPGGRFQDAGLEHVRRQIVVGAERFEEGGRSFMQSRCVQLARMGCVVFHYDKIGYGDSRQIPQEVAHRFSRSRLKFKQAPASGFYSASALLRMQNMMGLHTYNSIRALDFLTSLPDVDPKRIAVTGGSGGGTQTFMLCAVDDRPLVSVPVVIVSTTRQGGCTCENICNLRLGTFNLEFNALHAPKPLMLISADDATRNMAMHGFPELRQLYATLGAKQEVAHVPLIQYPHNYNSVSRMAMYGWLNKHLDLGLQEPILEKPYRLLKREQLSVWGKDHPQPPGGPAFEKKLLGWLSKDDDRQLAKLTPTSKESLLRFREVVGAAIDNLIRQQVPQTTFVAKKTADKGTHQEVLGLLRYRSVEQHDAELPVVILRPKTPGHRAVVWIHPDGKAGLYDNEGGLQPPVKVLIEKGYSVIGVDLLYQGEFLANGKPPARARHLPGEDGFAGWTYCYNLPLFTRRVHDILATVAFAKQRPKNKEVALVGLRGAGHWTAAALAQGRQVIDRAAIDTAGVRFTKLRDVYDVDFFPGIVKYGDLPALLALGAPTKLWLAGEGKVAPSLVRAAYGAAGKEALIQTYTGKQPSKDVIQWLLK